MIEENETVKQSPGREASDHMSDLLPCPFCSGKTVIITDTTCGDNYRKYAELVACGDCGARGPWADTENIAADLWNQAAR